MKSNLQFTQAESFSCIIKFNCKNIPNRVNSQNSWPFIQIDLLNHLSPALSFKIEVFNKKPLNDKTNQFVMCMTAKNSLKSLNYYLHI